MHKVRPDQRWNPQPPPHTEPWGGWATHEMIDLRARLHDLQRLLEEVTDELDRRADLIEAERKAKLKPALPILSSIASNPALPYFAALALLTSTIWLSGDKEKAIEVARENLLPKPK